MAATAARYTVRKSTVAGWEIVDRTDDTVASVAKNRDQARAIAAELNTTPEVTDDVEVLLDEVQERSDAEAEADAVHAEVDRVNAAEAALDALRAEELAPVTGDQVRTSPVFAALSEEARETVAARLDALPTNDDVEVEDDAADEQDRPELHGDAPAADVKPAKPAKAKAKAEAPATEGATIPVRKLEGGEVIKLRGVGPVKIVGKVKVAKLRFLVEYEAVADGEYGSVELWANSTYRLV